MSGSDAAGFTLLEALVALAIAMLLLTAAPRLVAPGAGALDAAAGLVAGELRRARETALSTGREQAVTFDAAARAVRAGEGPARRLPEGVSMRFTTAAEARAALGAPGVVFFEDGGATGGEIILSRGEDRVTLTVRWLTGAVRRDG